MQNLGGGGGNEVYYGECENRELRRYEFLFRVVKTIFHERAPRVSKIMFLTREDKIHIFKPLCNFIFIF